MYEFGLVAKPSSNDVRIDWGLRILHLADQEKVVEELQECEDEGQIFLAVDKVPIMEVQDSSEASPSLLPSHHICNICYPVGLESVYTFLNTSKPVKQGVVFNCLFSALHA